MQDYHSWSQLCYTELSARSEENYEQGGQRFQ